MQKEERSKVTAGTRYENNKRDLEQSLKTRQGGIQARLRQGRSTGQGTIVPCSPVCIQPTFKKGWTACINLSVGWKFTAVVKLTLSRLVKHL